MVELLDISIARRPTPKPKAAPPTGWTTIRQMPDGSVEQAFGKRRRRAFLTKCVECESDRPESAFSYVDLKFGHGLNAGICRDCWLSQARLAAAAVRVEARERINTIMRFPLHFGSADRRMAIVKCASPAWRDRAKINGIYEESRRLSRETGQPHDVDHYYPLQSPLCCGLHVHDNLRVVKASENRSKSNGFPMGDSPAWGESDPVRLRMAVMEYIEGLTR